MALKDELSALAAGSSTPPHYMLNDLKERVDAICALNQEAEMKRKQARLDERALIEATSLAVVPDDVIERLADVGEAVAGDVISDIDRRVRQVCGRRNGDVYPGDPGYPTSKMPVAA
jgi:hypothetical protein